MSVVLRETVGSDKGQAEILIETDDLPEGRALRYQDYGELRGSKELISQSFQKGMDLIRTCAEQVTSAVETLSKAAQPAEIEVEFGIKLAGEMGALIAKESAEAHLQVTLKWKRVEAP
jgi:NTP-dependent ternary system trypsin peptidase co-occuring protein